jgi:hypothetical protein
MISAGDRAASSLARPLANLAFGAHAKPRDILVMTRP